MGKDAIRYLDIPARAVALASHGDDAQGRVPAHDAQSRRAGQWPARAVCRRRGAGGTVERRMGRHRRGPTEKLGDAIRAAVSVTDTSAPSSCARRAGRQRIIWTNEQRSRDDWPRAWRWIEPVFGDVDPKTVTPELLLDLRTS